MSNPTDYPDYFSPGGFGTGDLVFVNSQNIAASQIYNPGTFYVGAAQSLQLEMVLFAGGPVQFSVLFSSQLAAQTINTVAYTKSAFNTTQDSLPILAPFVTFEVLNQSPTTQATIGLYASVANVSPGSGSFGGVGGGGTRILARVPFQVLAPAASATNTPFSSVPGPALLTVYSTNAPVQATIRMLAGTYAGQDIAALSTTYAGVSSVCSTVSLPNDDWELFVNNASAANQGVQVSVVSMR